MSSTTTTNNSPWYFYVRRVGPNWKLGIVDKDGDPHTTADIEIKIYYEKLANEIESDNDLISIPLEHLANFAKGCAYDYLQLEGVERKDYLGSYEFEIRKAIHKVTQQSNQPLIVKPITIVPKR